MRASLYERYWSKVEIREACGSHPPHPGSPLCCCERIAAAIRTRDDGWQQLLVDYGFPCPVPLESARIVFVPGTLAASQASVAACTCIINAEGRVQGLCPAHMAFIKPENDSLRRAYLDQCKRTDAERARGGRLVEALAEMIDAVQFMSGSADFGEGGQAHEGWLKVRPKLEVARAALAAKDAMNHQWLAERAKVARLVAAVDATFRAWRSDSGEIEGDLSVLVAARAALDEPAPAPEVDERDLRLRHIAEKACSKGHAETLLYEIRDIADPEWHLHEEGKRYEP